MEVRRDILWRVYLSFIGIALLGAGIAGKVIYIQYVQGSYWRGMSDSLHQRFVEIDPERGTIYSEDGQMLSTSVPVFDIYMDCMADGLTEKNGKRFYDNVDSFSYAMAKYFKDNTKQGYKNEITKAFKQKMRYYPLKKKLSFEDYKVFRDFPLVRLGRNKSGIIPDVSAQRLMPFRSLAKRTIGLSREYVMSNGKVKDMNVGLEKSYDTVLKGQTGKRLVRFIAGGVAVPVDGYEIEPESGKDIYTTLDVNMQDITETALLKMLYESDAAYGTAIVMETSTGKVKALSNFGRQPDGSYAETLNYALRTTEPGSTIKLATLLSVLSEGKTKSDDLVEVGTKGNAFVGVRNITDAERSPKSVLTVKECFAHSSNVGMGMLAYKTFAKDPDVFKEYLHKYHLDQRTGIDLTGEEKPRLPKMERNKGGLMDMITASFGYAIEVSPMQTLTLYNAIANDGKMMRPYLVNSVKDAGLTVKDIEPVVLENKIADKKIIEAAKESMIMVIKEGTGKYVFKDFPVPVAGKTGTAHVADGKLGYGGGVYQASFVGYFPANNPQYSCIVVIRTKPHAAVHYGGSLAAPVFKEIATKLYAMYVDKKDASLYTYQNQDSTQKNYAGSNKDIAYVLSATGVKFNNTEKAGSWSDVAMNNFGNTIGNKSISQKAMPDLKGMGLKDVVYILESMGLKVKVKGKGKLKNQSLPAGEEVPENGTVYVEFG